MVLKNKFNYFSHLYQFPLIYLNQWKSTESIRALQDRRLKSLVNHAYANVRYYRQLFDSHKIKPEDISSVKDLDKIPILTKDTILAHYPDQILASNLDWSRCSPRMTSGSSGKKLEVVLDHRVASQYRIMQLRQLIDIGYAPWDKIVYIRYSPPVTAFSLQKLGFFRRYYIPLEWTPERQISEILRLKPQILNAYPSVLYLIARSISSKQAKQIGLKFILSNSELLTQHVQEYLEEVFECKVYNDYSCLEFSAIAFECRMQNMHIASDNVVVEILDEKGNQSPAGKEGQIIITALNNYAMPYIRYEIGDIGTLSDVSCPCGRCFPLLKSIIGRCDDFLAMPSGHLIDPQTVVFQIEVIPEIKEFRVIQQKDYTLAVSVVLEKEAEFERINDQIKEKLNSVLNGVPQITVTHVPTLERGATGKHRSIISHISRGE